MLGGYCYLSADSQLSQRILITPPASGELVGGLTPNSCRLSVHDAMLCHKVIKNVESALSSINAPRNKGLLIRKHVCR